MSTSPTFYYTFKNYFTLLSLEVWLTYPRGNNICEFTPDNFMLLIEIDNKDTNKQQDILKYFNKNHNILKKNWDTNEYDLDLQTSPRR